MSSKSRHSITLDQFKDKRFGRVGTPRRDEFEEGYENFKIGALIHDARLEKGLTKAQLAARVGTTKSYISKIENNLKEVRLSTLKKIVEGKTARLKGQEFYLILLFSMAFSWLEPKL